MTDLPSPAAFADSILASFLRADPGRLSVLKSIIHHLDDDGRVGDAARFYIVQNAYRRAVLRGTLIAVGIKLPSWACENPAASLRNREFIHAYREQYNLHRREKRLRSQALGHQRAPEVFTAAARLSAAIH